MLAMILRDFNAEDILWQLAGRTPFPVSPCQTDKPQMATIDAEPCPTERDQSLNTPVMRGTTAVSEM